MPPRRIRRISASLATPRWGSACREARMWAAAQVPLAISAPTVRPRRPEIPGQAGVGNIYASGMVGQAKDGRTWRIGTDAEVGWIANGTSIGRSITAAIPPVFEAYATIVLPFAGQEQDEHDRAVLALLTEQSPGQRWWLGYLDTGADDTVFPGAPKVSL